MLGAQDQFEDHGERRLAAEASLGLDGSEPYRGEGALDGIGGSDVLPMLGREVVESQQSLPVLGEAFDGLVVFRTVMDLAEVTLDLREPLENPERIRERLGVRYLLRAR